MKRMHAKMKPVVYKGKICQGYYLDEKGYIYSNKQSAPGYLRQMSQCVHGGKPYPRVSIQIDGVPKTIFLHRLVCETFHPFPKPHSITSKDWRKTPKAVKRLVQNNFQVNHIDHVHANFHPSNLEWVDVTENQRKYQEHRKKSV